MLKIFAQRKPAGANIAFARGPIPLHAMVSSAGHEHRHGHEPYDWHGLKRGAARFCLFQYTLRGEGRLTYEGKTHTVRPGQAMLLHFPHDNRYWLPAGGDWCFFYLCLHGTETIRAFRYLIDQSGPLLDLDPKNPALQTAARLCVNLIDGKIQSVWEASREAYGVTMALLDKGLPGVSHDSPKRQPGFIEPVIDAIRNAGSKPLTVDDLADLSGYSRYHFSRLFKASTGLAPGEYLQRERLSRAVQLLTNRSLTIKAIAAECGFPDANYFVRAFKNNLGTTPGQFRRSGMYYTSSPRL